VLPAVGAPREVDAVRVELTAQADAEPRRWTVNLALLCDEEPADEKLIGVDVEKKEADAAAGRVALTVARPAVLRAGEQDLVFVQVRRGEHKGPLTLTLKDPPAGVSLREEVLVPAGTDFAMLTVRTGLEAEAGSRTVRLLARADGKEVGDGEFVLSITRPGGFGIVPRRGGSEDVSFFTADGVTLRGTLYPSSAKKDAACVLMLPDLAPTFSRKDRNWVALAETLQKAGFDVLTFDYRGHGDSTLIHNGPQFWSYRQNQVLPGRATTLDARRFPTRYYSWLVQDIAAARAFLGQRHDDGKVNEANLIVLGAGEGASLGVLWLGAELHRFANPFGAMPGMAMPGMAGPRGVPGAGSQPEVRDVVACVWLGMPGRLGRRNEIAVTHVLLLLKQRERPPLMGFFTGADSTDTLNRRSTKTGTLTVRKVPGTRAFGAALVNEPRTAEAVRSYLEETLRLRGTRAWERRMNRTTFWAFPSAPVAPATTALLGGRIPLVPLEQVLALRAKARPTVPRGGMMPPGRFGPGGVRPPGGLVPAGPPR
jgi:predicted alpha/beta hydrolase